MTARNQLPRCPLQFVVPRSSGLVVDDALVVQTCIGMQSAEKRRVLLAIDGVPVTLAHMRKLRMKVPMGCTVNVAAMTRSAAKLQSKMIDQICDETGHCVISGAAGTGKTYAYEKIAQRERAGRPGRAPRHLLCLAPTATAASRLPDSCMFGRCEAAITVARALQPSYWKGLPRQAPSPLPGGRQKKQRKRPDMAPVALTVILDEYSMVPGHHLDEVAAVLNQSGLEWRMLLGGDWRQLEPVDGLPPWSSEFATGLIDSHAPVYCLDAYNRRYRECPGMAAMSKAFLHNDRPGILRWLATLASATFPDDDGDAEANKRYMAFRRVTLQAINKSVRERLVRNGAVQFTLKGGDGSELTLADGMLVKWCRNAYDPVRRQYTHRNGDQGIIEAGGMAGVVDVTESTRVRLRRPNGDLDLLPPLAVGDHVFSDGSSKRRRHNPQFTYVHGILPYTGLTVHSGQGDTFEAGTRLVVDVSRMPDINMIYTALFRVRQMKDLRVVNYDPGAVSKLLQQCPCKCDRVLGRRHGKPRCNKGSLEQRRNWLVYLATHTSHVAADDRYRHLREAAAATLPPK